MNVNTHNFDHFAVDHSLTTISLILPVLSLSSPIPTHPQLLMHLLFPDMSLIILIPDYRSALFQLPVSFQHNLRVYYSNHPLAMFSDSTQLDIFVHILHMHITQQKKSLYNISLWLWSCFPFFSYLPQYLVRIVYSTFSPWICSWIQCNLVSVLQNLSLLHNYLS